MQVGNLERCEPLGTMLERVCCGGPVMADDDGLAPLLFLSRYFAALRDAAYANRLTRLFSEPSRCRSADERSYQVSIICYQADDFLPLIFLATCLSQSDTSFKSIARRDGPPMSSALFAAVLARRAALKIQRVVRGHAARCHVHRIFHCEFRCDASVCVSIAPMALRVSEVQSVTVGQAGTPGGRTADISPPEPTIESAGVGNSD